MIEEYKSASIIFGLPNCLINCLASVKSVLNEILKKFKPRLGFMLSRSTSKDAYEYLKLSYRHQVIKEDFVEMWRHHNLDLLICPGFGSQAVKHGYSEDTTLAACYTFVWNLL
jgi:ubiquinone/menaquinone biosynthesis C-methylase UbiE